MKYTWKYVQCAKLTVLNIPDPRFPEDGKVELLLSDSPDKITGRLLSQKMILFFFSLI